MLKSGLSAEILHLVEFVQTCEDPQLVEGLWLYTNLASFLLKARIDFPANLDEWWERHVNEKPLDDPMAEDVRLWLKDLLNVGEIPSNEKLFAEYEGVFKLRLGEVSLINNGLFSEKTESFFLPIYHFCFINAQISREVALHSYQEVVTLMSIIAIRKNMLNMRSFC